MTIKKIEVTNFKSFKKLKLELGKFNVLIGANASGKSNFIQLFHFLRDIANFGLDNAIAMQGGIDYLTNIKIGSLDNFSLKLTTDTKFHLLARFVETRKNKGQEENTKRDSTHMESYETVFEFALNLKKRRKRIKIVKDQITFKVNFLRMKNKKEEIIGKGKIVLFNERNKLKIDVKPKTAPVKAENLIPEYFINTAIPPNTLLFDFPFFLVMPTVKDFFNGISIYDFDPKASKRSTRITGKAELEEDANNLAFILKIIMQQKDEKRKFFNLIKELLPFVDNLHVREFVDKSLIFEVEEHYFKKHYLPSSFISDGTINIAALIIALYFSAGKPFVIFEEPGRNIHPFLIGKVINMMREVSNKTQIIVTTHNPEIIKFAGLENILFISRNKYGFSSIFKAKDSKVTKTFLKNKIGIDELFIQNLIR